MVNTSCDRRGWRFPARQSFFLMRITSFDRFDGFRFMKAIEVVDDGSPELC